MVDKDGNCNHAAHVAYGYSVCPDCNKDEVYAGVKPSPVPSAYDLGIAQAHIRELEDFVLRLSESKNYFAWWRYVDEARALAGLPPRTQSGAKGEVK